ncbi:MAG: rRNA maturation RNase YbeY [Xanthomonadaceae bacterium]|nr:rRNA maturation RNase YbeY [Xanthomonadaceae bacterium]
MIEPVVVSGTAATLDVQQALDAADLPAPEQLLHWVEAALETENHGVELVIRLVDEAESAELNEAYRGKTGPTNVLSFPFDMPPEVEETRLLGDLVICAPVVRREAAEQGKTEPAHWAHLVVHGTLHLQGYDHQTEAGATEMEGLERQILARLGYPDPYHEEANPA